MTTGLSIFYNGQDAFYPQPTPFVGVDEDNVYYGELWAKQETLTLNGQLTGCSFDIIAAAQQTLVSNFGKSYQTLEIHQQDGAVYSGVVYTQNLAQVDSISFQEGTWRGVLPYTIRLKCYPASYFSGSFGILDPVDTWNFEEQQNYVARVSHTVACRGINTSAGTSNALDNAINWATAKRGTTNIVTPTFIENVTPANLCLITSNENIDRFNGRYSITDNYINDQARNGYGVIRYSATLDSGDYGVTVAINGTVQGCNKDIAAVRDAFNTFDPLGAASFLYQEAFNLNDLNPVPLTNSISEDAYNAILSFSYVYDNSSLPPVFYDYTVSISSGNNITASVNGNVIARGGDVKTKMIRAREYAASLNLYNLVSSFYSQFYPYASQYPLNPAPVSLGTNVNESKGILSLSASYSNQAVFNPSLASFEYTLSFQPSVEKIDFQPLLDGQGQYSAVDVGYAPRASLAVRGTARINANADVNAGTSAIKQAAQSLFDQYGGKSNVTLDVNSLTEDRNDLRVLSFNFVWSFDSPNKVANTPYRDINTFSVK